MPESKIAMGDIDFLFIGATKSATTWLQQSLQTDPIVCMPGPEIHYFSREYDRGHNWYLEQFPQITDGQLVGEKSNSYMDDPEAAARIYDALPSVRLVAQLRNPIERAYSDYCMLFRRGEVDRNIERYLDPRSAANGRFLTGGQYYRQLSTYLEHYDSNQLMILLYEDLQHDSSSHLRSVRNFLGLSSDTVSSPIEKMVKYKNTPIIAPGLRRYLRPLKPVVSPLRQHRCFKALHGLIARKVEYAELDTDLRKRLIEYYSKEVESLGHMMRRDLTGWLQETPSTGPELSYPPKFGH